MSAENRRGFENREVENSSGLSFGLYYPEKFITNEEIESWEVATKTGALTSEKILQRTGVEKRFIAQNEGVIEMGVKAAEKAITKERKVNTLLASSSYPIGENIARRISRELGLNLNETDNRDFHFACSGFAEMLSHIHEKEEEFKGKNVLLVSTEKYSPTLIDLKRVDAVSKDPSLASTIFSDGAAAVLFKYGKDLEVLSSVKKVFGEELNQNIRMPIDKSKMSPPYSCYSVPPSDIFYQNGREVYKAVRDFASEQILKAISEASLVPEEIDLVIPHQGSIHVVEDGIEKRLSEENSHFEGRVVTDISEGNFSSASIPKAMAKAFGAGKIGKGSTLVLAGFGAGLYSSTVVVRL